MRAFFLFFLLLPLLASAETLPPNSVKAKVYSGDGLQAIANVSDALKVYLANPTTSVVVSNFPAVQPISATSLPLPTGAATEATLSALNGKIITTVNGVKVDGSAVTQPISAASLPLPSGASTSANQATGNASLASIDSKLTSPIAVTGPLTDTQLRASPVAVYGTVTVAPSGTQDTNIKNVNGVAVNVGTGTAGTGTQRVAVASDSSLAVTNFPATQPISAASLPLPTGAATSALQTTGNTSLSSIDGKIPSNLTVSSARLLVDGSGVTQPISAASLPLPSGAATAANQATANSSLSAIATAQTDGTQKSKLVDGSGNVAGPFINLSSLYFVPTFSVANGTAGAAPSGYLSISGGINAGGFLQEFTLDGSGNLNVKVNNFPATQSVTQGTSPWVVSGTVSAAQSGAWSVGRTWTLASGTDSVTASLAAGSNTIGKVDQGVGGASAWKVDGSAVTQPISAAALPLPSGAATSALQTTGNSSLSSIDSKVPANLTVSSTRLLVDGSGVTQPISAASLPLPSGAATETSLAKLTQTQGSTTSGQSGTLMQGAVTTNSPSYTTAQTSPLSLNIRGALRSAITGGDSAQLIRNSYSTTNVTTAAYVQLVASTTSNINRLWIFDSSGQDFVLATGAAASEVDQIRIPPGGWDSPVDIFIPSGTRISIKASSATASSGLLIITGIK